jgi:hypothetical protein
MATARIPLAQAELAEFCQRNGIRKLVEFEPSLRVGLFKMAALERELTSLFGRKVDLRTPDELSRYFRNDVVRSAQVQYDSQ